MGSIVAKRKKFVQMNSREIKIRPGIFSRPYFEMQCHQTLED